MPRFLRIVEDTGADLKFEEKAPKKEDAKEKEQKDDAAKDDTRS